MSKKLDKILRQQEREDEIAEFIADNAMKNWHHTTLTDLIKAFPQWKEKHIKKALKELS